MGELHARNQNQKPYSLSGCCGVATGWHKCTGSSKKSDLDRFGVGIVHYFRFIKYMGLFFFLATIMSIPSLFFATQCKFYHKNGLTNIFSAARDFDSGEISANFKELLYMTSMASIAVGKTQTLCF